MISGCDIGTIRCILICEPGKYMSRTVAFAGNESTAADFEKKYEEIIGRPIELTYESLASSVKTLVRHEGIWRK